MREGRLMRDLSKNLVDASKQLHYFKLKSLYIAPCYNSNNLAVVIKAIEDYIYFVDGSQVYRSIILQDSKGKFFKFLNKRFYFKDFEKVYL